MKFAIGRFAKGVIDVDEVRDKERQDASTGRAGVTRLAEPHDGGGQVDALAVIQRVQQTPKGRQQLLQELVAQRLAAWSDGQQLQNVRVEL